MNQTGTTGAENKRRRILRLLRKLIRTLERDGGRNPIGNTGRAKHHAGTHPREEGPPSEKTDDEEFLNDLELHHGE